VIRRLWLFLLFTIAVVTDQASKLAVDSYFGLYHSQNIFGNYLRLTYVRNQGAAFGISFGGPKVMLTVSVLVIILLLYMFIKGSLRPSGTAGKAAVIMVIAGAIGNIIDRIRMGEVIDFLDMGIGGKRWPVYNLADVYVTIGMIILLYVYMTEAGDARESTIPSTE